MKFRRTITKRPPFGTEPGVQSRVSLYGFGGQIWRKFNRDGGGDKAAELSFFFTFAFFPLVVFLITLLGFLPGADDMIFGYLNNILPPEAWNIIHRWGITVFQHHNGGLLSFSLMLTLWSASTGVAGLMDVFNVAYGVQEGRSYWKYRLVALVLTLGLALLVFGGALLVTFGAIVVRWLAWYFQFGGYVAATINALNAIVGLIMLFLGISILNYFGPNVEQRWRFFTPGAAFSVIGTLIVSYVFSLYLQIAPSYTAVYGGLGAMIIFMLWLYLIGIILIIGGEINSEIQRASGIHPHVRVESKR